MSIIVKKSFFQFRKKENKAVVNGQNNGSFKDKLKLIMSKLSGGFMLPIAVMSISGLFLGIGATIESQSAGVAGLALFGRFLKEMGLPIFSGMPIFFAAAFVVSFTDEAGVGVFASIVGFLTFLSIQSVFIETVSKNESLAGLTTQELADKINSGYTMEFLNPGASDYAKVKAGLGVEPVDITQAVRDVALGRNISVPANHVVYLHTNNAGGYNILFSGLGREPLTLSKLVGTTLGVRSLQTSIFGGITVGITVAKLYNKYHTIQLPTVVAFFGGKRFVALVTIIAMVPLAFIYLILWPYVGWLLNFAGTKLGQVPYGFESFIFGYIERSLIPFGLHHVFYSPLWYTSAGGDLASQLTEWQAAGNVVKDPEVQKWISEVITSPQAWQGDIATVNLIQNKFDVVNWTKDGVNHSAKLYEFAAQELSIKYGRYMQGKFSFMQFGLPAAAAAMIFAAPKENRKLAAGTVIPAALTSFVTGVTEPIEFTFLFLSPALFWGFHAGMAALSFLLMNILGAHIGITFSGGILDMVIYGIIPLAKGTNFWWWAVIGVIYAPIYFFVFYYWIKVKNLSTPGRGGNTRLFTKNDFKTKNSNSSVSPQVIGIIEAYGGAENIVSYNNCASRLRYDVKDASKVDHDKLKSFGAFGVSKSSNTHVQAIFGPKAEQINTAIVSYIKSGDKNTTSAAELKETTKTVKISKSTLKVLATVEGKVKTLESLKDGVFSEKMMGDGLVISPDVRKKKAKFYAPVDATLTTVFSTGHAFGLTTKEGATFLIHIGIDTVNLKGKGFDVKVTQDQQVKAGDLLVEVDLEFIRSKKLPTDTIVVVTDESTKKIATKTKLNKVTLNDSLFTVK